MTAEEIRVILAEVAAGVAAPAMPGAQRQRPGVRGRSGAVVAGGFRLRDMVRGAGSPWQNGYAESFHSKVRDEFLNREEFESEPQARALGRSGGRSTIPNARTVPWDIRHRPNSRPLVRGMCLSMKTDPIHRPLNQRTGDSHYRWTKKWGAGQYGPIPGDVSFSRTPGEGRRSANKLGTTG